MAWILAVSSAVHKVTTITHSRRAASSPNCKWVSEEIDNGKLALVDGKKSKIAVQHNLWQFVLINESWYLIKSSAHITMWPMKTCFARQAQNMPCFQKLKMLLLCYLMLKDVYSLLYHTSFPQLCCPPAPTGKHQHNFTFNHEPLLFKSNRCYIPTWLFG